MDTLDRCIRDLIQVHPKRSGPSGRRFGAEVPGNPGFVASLKHGRGARDARGEASREQGSWLLRGSICLPVFLLCQWTISRNRKFVHSRAFEVPLQCAATVAGRGRHWHGRDGQPPSGHGEQAAAHPGSNPRTLERYRARVGGPRCVPCRSRVHHLRSGLDERVGKDGRPVAVESKDDCVRNGWEIASAENKF